MSHRDDICFLFLLKGHTYANNSTGLYNSSLFIVDMLKRKYENVNMCVVVDADGISAVVEQYKPSHIVVEALWITPTDLKNIVERHDSSIKWIVRIHSNIPFLAGENIAMDWICDYSSLPNVIIAPNTLEAVQGISFILKTKHNWDDVKVSSKVVHLPNYYPIRMKTKHHNRKKPCVDISCFGAIRPLKNHLIQAVAAIEFANRIGKKLNFHINVSKVEMNGSSSLKNLADLFQHVQSAGHQLIGHNWVGHEEFVKLCGQMDIGMQCSLSETFNIVAADTITQGVPIVCSPQIEWADKGVASPTKVEDIINSLMETYDNPQLNVTLNQKGLIRYIEITEEKWFNNKDIIHDI